MVSAGQELAQHRNSTPRNGFWHRRARLKVPEPAPQSAFNAGTKAEVRLGREPLEHTAGSRDLSIV